MLVGLLSGCTSWSSEASGVIDDVALESHSQPFCLEADGLLLTRAGLRATEADSMWTVLTFVMFRFGFVVVVVGLLWSDQHLLTKCLGLKQWLQLLFTILGPLIPVPPGQARWPPVFNLPNNLLLPVIHCLAMSTCIVAMATLDWFLKLLMVASS